MQNVMRTQEGTNMLSKTSGIDARGGAGAACRRLALVLVLGVTLAGAAWAADDTDADGVADPADNCLVTANPSQLDADGDGFGNACDADLNDDGIVNFSDLARMRAVFFRADPVADMSGDGVVNFTDLAMLRAAFFKPPGPSGLLPSELPVFDVVKSGLTTDESARLAEAFGFEKVPAEDGSLRFVSDQLGDLPMLADEAVPGAAAADLPRDEDGQETRAQAFDLPAIQQIVPVGERTALVALETAFKQADVRLPGGEDASPHVSHSIFYLESLDGSTSISRAIDTSVRLDFSLAGRPLLGPGAKLRVTFAPSGELTAFDHAVRELAEGATVPLISPFDARSECARYYPEGSKLAMPRIVYWAPGLEQHVQTVFPHWQCQGKGPHGEELVAALLPAVQASRPAVTLDASVVRGSRVMASVGIRGGTPPFSYSWQSMTTELSEEASSEPSIFYEVVPREPTDTEVLGVTVTDANGLVGKARAVLGIEAAAVAMAADIPGPLSLSVLDVGGEFNVYEWNCVKQSSAGFAAVFANKGIPVAFRWNGTNAWERDFRESSSPTNGDDASFADNVDLAWYTGHGSPGSFTFDNATKDDGSIVPNDARWGNRDLEWMQLESCNVLQFDSGGVPIWNRWAKVFDGLHLLNGFQTTASCVDTPSGTAGRFSKYLFPTTIFNIPIIPALRVRQAWARMAIELEPAGRQYVTMGAAAAGWVTNYNDYFWGQGPVGFDIPKSQIVGYWWVMGEV